MTRRAPVLVVVLSTGAALLTAVVPRAASATTPVVTLDSDSALISTFQFVDDAHQASPDDEASDFFAYGHTLDPPKQQGPSGTASAFLQQVATMETPAQPPLPASPLNDIALTGTSTAGATRTNNDTAGVPVADSEGQLSVSFTSDQPVPVFYSGVLLTTETDTDECSYAEVDLDGPTGFTPLHFVASSPNGCDAPGATRQAGWATSMTLPAGDYEMTADYYSEVDDTTDEAASMSASSKVSVNLAFMPPTARFTTKLAGSRATFNAGGSSAGPAARPLAKYVWDFGDGSSRRTTTTPTVAHSFPASPRTARTYKVTLQVVDDGGARSAPVSHNVLGTATSLGVTKHATKVTAAGAVTPSRRGHRVDVTLARRQGGRFHNLATHHPTLTSTSHYSTTFARAAAGTCRLTTRYPGDATHLASSRARVFAC
ncbi:MAG TPA: PKD domain-containing protein [Mycobacteriales bacterium]|nr:PKD domain-containing protein [Mycobacteriales bacterium]